MPIDERQIERVFEILRGNNLEKFSSHDFIEVYCAEYEDDYIDWLCEYRGTNKAFQTVHSQIGRYLADLENDPGSIYRRTMRGNSENVHGTIDQPMWWEWRR